MTKRLFSLCRPLLLLLAVLMGLPATAQNLITNPGFESGNTGFTSGYKYIPNPQSPNGNANRDYSVVSNSNKFNINFGNYADHTGNGLYLVADGATAANIVVWEQTVSNLSPNRDYVFSF